MKQFIPTLFDRCSSTQLRKTVFGCANFGGFGSFREAFGRGNSKREAFELLDLADEMGIRFFDTANTYANGESEEILGQWLRSKGNSRRDDFFIASKVGNAFGQDVTKRSLHPKDIQVHIEKTLSRLRIDMLDLYFTHMPDPKVPIDVTFDAFFQLKRQGKIRFMGASNIDQEKLNAYIALDNKLKDRFFYGIQNSFSLMDRDDRLNLFPILNEKKLHYWAYSPLAGGLLSGKYKPYAAFAADSRLDVLGKYYGARANLKFFSNMAQFNRLAQSFQASPSALALAWMRHQPEVTGVIVGPKSEAHLHSVKESFALKLTPSEFRLIESCFVDSV